MKATNLFGYIFLAFILVSSEARALEPLYDGLGSYTRKISTKSAEAQKYFDQGINFYFGFNHSAALRAFQAAEALDPGCAMNYWGRRWPATEILISRVFCREWLTSPGNKYSSRGNTRTTLHRLNRT